MNLIEAFIHNPVKVWVGVLLVVLFGANAWLGMPMQLTPEVQTPTITVETLWPGASPQDVEREIVQEQEEQLKGVEGVTKLSSESSDSMAMVTLEFAVGTNMNEALLRVNARLQQVPEYPEDADEPVIRTSSSSDQPIAWFILGQSPPSTETMLAFAAKHPQHKAKIDRIVQFANPGIVLHHVKALIQEDSAARELLPDDIDVSHLRKFAEDFIESRLERVSGVSNSNVIGGVDPEMQVIVDPQQLAARRITIPQLREVLRAENVDISAGDLWEGKRRWVVRSLNQFRSPEQVAEQIITVTDGAPVYVRDVASVELNHKKPVDTVRRFGSNTIAVNVIRETGANVLDIMARLRVVNAELNEKLLAPRGLILTQVYDETEYIHSAVNLVRENIFTGSALTMITLMLFLHLNRRSLMIAPLIAGSALAAVYLSSWWFLATIVLIIVAGFWFARGALVISLAIPVSIVGTFLFLDGMGRSLNVISLAGMAFAVGMLVDNAVVVLENIDRYYQMGLSALEAAQKATEEVWGAVLASTLTTLAVFIPVLYVKEEAGQLFGDIALAISASIALSLIVSITLIPMVAARLLRRGESLGELSDESTPDSQNTAAGEAASSALVVRWLRSAGGAFHASTVSVNRWIQESTTRRLIVALGMAAASVCLTYLFWPKVDYLPAGNRNLIIGLVLPPPGYNLTELTSLGETVERELKAHWDVLPNEPAAAKLPFPIIEDAFFVARGRQVFIGMRAKEPTEARKLIPAVMQLTPKMPGAFCIALQSSLFARGLTPQRSVNVEISGPRLERLVELGLRVLVKAGPTIEPNPELAQAQSRPIPSLDLSSPELQIEPLRMQSREGGLSASELGYTVNALIDGAYAADYFLAGDKIDLAIVGVAKAAERTQDVEGLPIATPTGELVPLRSVATVRMGSGPEQVNHRERQRTITIEVTPPPQVPLQEAIERINREIIDPMVKAGDLGGEYTVNLSGAADKLRDTWNSLYFNFLIALLITYLLMAALFESWSYPLVIILSVPLGMVGGVIGLAALNAYLLLLGEPPQALDVLTMLGFVILVGTVVNNPILIVHQALQHMQNDHMTPRDAVVESVRNRIRPIFMTTMTTLLGLLPLVLFPGAGSELYRGIGAVVLGGLGISTLFTLVMIPPLFTLFTDLLQVVNRIPAEPNPTPAGDAPVLAIISAKQEENPVGVGGSP